MVGLIMAYHRKRNCFHCSLLIIKLLFVFIANGETTVKQSRNGEDNNFQTEIHLRVLEEISSLRNEIEFMKDRTDDMTKIINTSREVTLKIREETSKIREETSKIKEETSKIRKETRKIKEETSKIKLEITNSIKIVNVSKEETSMIKEEILKIKEETSKMKEYISKIIENANSQLSDEIKSSRDSLLSNVRELLRPNDWNPVGCNSLQTEQFDRKIQAFELILQKQRQLLEDSDGCQMSKILKTSREETSKIREATSKIVTDAVSLMSDEINRSRNTLLSNVTELLCSNNSKPVGCRSFQMEQLDRKIQALDLILLKQNQLIQDVHNIVVQRRDCADLRKSGSITSGIYEVMLPDERLVSVYCEMESSGTGWLVFQRRMDGSEDFYRGWNEYANGFGNKSGEFWLGNNFLHLLTSNIKYKLRVDLEDFEGNKSFAEYGTFTVGSAADKYRLTVGDYSGNAGDDLTYPHNGMQFSTKDSDNDKASTNCAEMFNGAWWYRACHYSDLNGLYLRGNHSSFADGVNWLSFRGFHYSLKLTEMKISPALISN